MIEFNVNTGNRTPVYKQLVSEIDCAIREGRLKPGELLPSMNELSDRLAISKETVKRSYGILCERGVIEAHQGKGFYVADESGKKSISVLFIFDKFSTYKQEIVHGFNQAIQEKCEETILLFNQDLKLFEYILYENLGKFDYYVVSPHFSLDAKTQRLARKLVGRIPYRKLIMVDNWFQDMQGNYGAAYQDFSVDAYEGLEQGLDRFSKSNRLVASTLQYSLYGPVMEECIRKFGNDYAIDVEFSVGIPETIRKGDTFLLLNGQLDMGIIDLVDKVNAAGLSIGEDCFIISYNESPIDKIVLNGLTTISTDFFAMGQEAAKMINERRMWKTHIPFRMSKRNTF